MVDRGGRARLAHEALAEVGVLGELRRDQLQRDRAVEVELERAVDDAHAAAARDPQDAVAGELVSLVQGGHGAFVQQAPHAPTCRAVRRAPISSPASMRGPSAIRAAAWGAWCSARPRRSSAAAFVSRRPWSPPPPPRRRSRCPLPRAARARATSASCACRCTPTSRPTRCPTTIPSACARGCGCATRCAPTAPRPRRAPGPAPAARLRAPRGRAAAPVAEQALVWCHWLWFGVPHGTVAYVLARRRDQLRARRRADLRGLRPRAHRLLGAADGAAVVRRARRARSDRAARRAADDARARTGGLEGRLGASLRCPRRQPPRRHALSALRDIRDGRARPRPTPGRCRARWGGPTRSRSGFALVYLGEHYVIDLLAGLALAEGVRRHGHRAAPALRAVSRTLQQLEARAHA